jgi:hypothetical protein
MVGEAVADCGGDSDDAGEADIMGTATCAVNLWVDTIGAPPGGPTSTCDAQCTVGTLHPKAAIDVREG